MKNDDAIISWLLKYEKQILIFAFFTFLGTFFLSTMWKYAMFQYNGIDLAYFNQVFWNTVHGRPFTQSIHPHLSLGDHAEFAILLLAPIYALFQDPRTLLLLQIIALAACVWPLWQLAKQRTKFVPDLKSLNLVPLVLCLVFLLNPSIQSIAVFEFHILPFVLLPFFFALVEYERGRKIPFLIFIFLSLLVREDVALMVIMMGVLAWMEKKSWWWKITPVILGLGWFLGVMKIISSFSVGGNYKFLVYYAWLGNTPLEMITHVITQPVLILSHILTFPNLEMMIGFLMPLMFLPLLKPKGLVLTIPALLQLILGSAGGGEIVVMTHYATLFLPGLFLATIDGTHQLPLLSTKISARGGSASGGKKYIPLSKNSSFSFILFFFVALYSVISFGPIVPLIKKSFSSEIRNEAKVARAMLANIPPQESVATSYALLPHLSSREHLYSLHYIFIGMTQFGTTKYVPPATIHYVALDTNDLLLYLAQMPNTAWTKPYFDSGFDRLQQKLGAKIFNRGHYILYDHTLPAADGIKMEKAIIRSQHFKKGIHLSGVSTTFSFDPILNSPLLTIHLSWKKTEPPFPFDTALVIQIILRNKKGTVVTQQKYPFGNAMTPASTLMSDEKIWTIYAPIFTPLLDVSSLELHLFKEENEVMLGDLRSLELKKQKNEDLGFAILPLL